MQTKYVAVYSYVQKTTGDSKEALTADEAALYSARRNNLTRIWREQMLTEEEITYWLGKEKEIETPFIFAYADGWADVFDNIYALNFMLLLLIAVCLSNVFFYGTYTQDRSASPVHPVWQKEPILC